MVTRLRRWRRTSPLSSVPLLLRERGQEATAQYFEEYADFLKRHTEPWTVTTEGSLVPGINRHFIRIHPADADDPQPDEDANHGVLELRNQPPGAPTAFPGKEIVDAGFLELVRYGIRKPGDPLVEDSLRVVDAVLKVDAPFGPCWRRYNHDGYGQRKDGGPYQGWGYGHAWPVLTGERGHYELAAAREVRPLIRAMEGFATSTQLLPEQVWALPDLPQAHMGLGRPTGGAMPLVWRMPSTSNWCAPWRTDRSSASSRRSPTATATAVTRLPWKSGNLTGRYARCLRGEPCGSKRLLPSDCTGPVMNGNKPMTRTPRPSGPVMNTRTSECQPGKRPRFASPSSGRWWGTGRGGTLQSALIAEESKGLFLPGE